MKFSIRIADVYCDILKETTKQIVIVKERKTYRGTLFFKKESWEKVTKVYEKVDFDGNTFEAMLVAYKLMKKHNLIAKDDRTFMTMAHWQHVNGLTDEWLDTYGYKNDTEVFKAFNIAI